MTLWPIKDLYRCWDNINKNVGPMHAMAFCEDQRPISRQEQSVFIIMMQANSVKFQAISFEKKGISAITEFIIDNKIDPL